MNATLVSYILKSKNRKKVLELLDKPKTTSQLVKSTDMYTTHAHRTIRELKEKKLVVQENPNDGIYKFYKISPLGKKVLSDVKKVKDEIKYKK